MTHRCSTIARCPRKRSVPLPVMAPAKRCTAGECERIAGGDRQSRPRAGGKCSAIADIRADGRRAGAGKRPVRDRKGRTGVEGPDCRRRTPVFPFRISCQRCWNWNRSASVCSRRSANVVPAPSANAPPKLTLSLTLVTSPPDMDQLATDRTAPLFRDCVPPASANVPAPPPIVPARVAVDEEGKGVGRGDLTGGSRACRKCSGKAQIRIDADTVIAG